MDERQMMQVLDQIPLDVLMQYVQQRAQTEQQSAGGGEEAMMPQQQMYARGGYIRRATNNTGLSLRRIR